MKKEEPILLANWIMAPDGTMIPSMNRHDYRTHETVDTWKKRSSKMDDYETVPDKTRHSTADGGIDYLKRGGVYTEMSVYSDDSFEVIRRFVCRGGRGEEGKDFLTYVPLFRMSNSWLEATIKYCEEQDQGTFWIKYYQMELDYRKKRGISIEERSE